MLYTYHSNRIDLLKDLTLQIMDIDPLNGVFDQEYVLVQSPGMTKWLMQEIAQSKGVCANAKFPLASSFIWNIYAAVLPQVPKQSAFTKDAMQWTLAKMLPSRIDNPEYKSLKNYLGLGDITDTKIHQLANRIADVFDGYQVYRPEWILQWESGEVDPELVKGQEWQPILWKELYEQITSEGKSHYHRANMYGEFLDAINKFVDEGKTLPSEFPKRIFIFGVSTLPPNYLMALEALGKLVDIHFMFFNPCHMYWGDIKDKKQTNRILLKQYQKKLIQGTLKDKYEDSLFVDAFDESVDLTLDESIGNSLLSSMGKLGRDNLSMMSQIEHQEEIVAFVELERTTLLKKLQDDVFNLVNRGDEKVYEHSRNKDEISPSDKSIVVKPSFSPMREIEVLHNELLNLFQNDPSLTPRDVIVMCADINKYSPYIEAVFGNVPKFDNRHIPFSISDKTAEHEHPIVAAFLKLINVNNSRYTAIEVMELLKTNAVLTKFDISDDEFRDLHDVIKGVGIRWGLDSSTSKNHELPSIDVNTWKFGIDRLLIGYSMPEECGFFEDSLPYDLPMNVSYELIGKLAKFISKLQYWNEQFSVEHSYKEWFEMIDRLLCDFFDVKDVKDFSAMELVKSTLQRFYTVLNDVNYEDHIPLAVINDEIHQRLTKEPISQRFLAGKLNFCTLMPMRSIPFKVVCLVGMNDGIYPRTTAIANYDLMGRNPRVGDRSRRNDDRYMFLEALLSAEEKVYISYVGNSVQDGAIKNPSILVQELLDYCSTGYCLSGDAELNADDSTNRLLNHLVERQAMTPYSEKDFNGQVGSYSNEWANAINTTESASSFCSKPLLLGEKDLDDGDNYRLNLSELMKFWKLPAKHFFTRRLKANLDIENDNLKEDEPFAFDALEAYTLRKDWLSKLVDDDVQSSEEATELHLKILESNRGSGKAPIAAFGEVLIDREREEVEDLAYRVTQVKSFDDSPIEIDLKVELANSDVIRIQGLVRDIYEKGVLCYRVGRVRPADIFDAWLRQLVLCASGYEKKVFIFGLDDSKMLKPVDQETAINLLRDLVELYYEGLTMPLPFLVDVVHESVKACFGRSRVEASYNAAMGKRMKAIYDRKYIENTAFGDPHVIRAWGNWSDSLGEDMFKLGLRVYQACFMCLADVDYD